MPIVSQKGQFLIFWPKFEEIAQLRAKFWFKYCWGCCRELGGGGNELGGGGWSWVEVEMRWVEVDGAGWSWVHGLVIRIINTSVSGVAITMILYVELACLACSSIHVSTSF